MQKNSRILTIIEHEREEETTKDILSQVDDSDSVVYVGADHYVSTPLKKQQKEIRKLEDSKISNTKVDTNRESIRSSTRKT